MSEEDYIMRSLRICTPHQIFLCDQIKNNKMNWAHAVYMREIIAYGILVGKPEGYIRLKRPRCRWEDNI